MLMFVSCSDKKEKKQIEKDKYQGVLNPSLYKELVNDEKARTRLWKAAIDSGDCMAYGKIGTAYLMTSNVTDLYYYSLIMANKYHCAYAYITMYDILTHQALPSTGDMPILSDDKDTKNLARYYLFKARELGDSRAKHIIELEFSKDTSSQNSSFFLKQLMNSPGNDSVSKKLIER
jgi:hypothetical protein